MVFYRKAMPIYCLSIKIYCFAIVIQEKCRYFSWRLEVVTGDRSRNRWLSRRQCITDVRPMVTLSFRRTNLAGLVLFFVTSIAFAEAPDSSGELVASDNCDACVSTHESDQCPCENRVKVEYGMERPLLDSAGWVIGIPRKLLLWDRRADNHAVSGATVGEVVRYLEYRGLDGTVVRVNQYAPGKEWKRLVSNHRVSPGWRYTVGSLKWLQYTLLPGRLFGRDQYNPYTNSLYLYSDMPTMGLAESAYAKDIDQRNQPGTYAAVQELPLVALWHETVATDEVLHYVSIRGSSEQIQKVRHDLYARYGIETAGAIGQVFVRKQNLRGF